MTWKMKLLIHSHMQCVEKDKGQRSNQGHIVINTKVAKPCVCLVSCWIGIQRKGQWLLYMCLADGSKVQGGGWSVETATGRQWSSERSSTRRTSSSSPGRSTDVLGRSCCQSSHITVSHLRPPHQTSKLPRSHQLTSFNVHCSDALITKFNAAVSLLMSCSLSASWQLDDVSGVFACGNCSLEADIWCHCSTADGLTCS